MLLYLLSEVGVQGAAIAWFARVVFDAVFLMLIVFGAMPDYRRELKFFAVYQCFVLLSFAAIISVSGIALKLVATALVFLIAFLIAGRLMFRKANSDASGEFAGIERKFFER